LYTNPTERPSPLILTNNIFKGPAHLVYYITLNLNISASTGKMSKTYLVALEPSMWGIRMPNFSTLASLVWEEYEVTNGCVVSHPIPIQNF